ncbi:hypothetical protein B5F88_15860 [Flavonifractor sp. An306]|nr:hypothetical protein B5F88_15860 [Flavonifractor sp. An306]
MQRLINGSETVDSHTVDRFCKLFQLSHDTFAPGYGLSECVCVATLSSRDYRSAAISLEAYRRGRFQPDPNGEKTIVSLGRPAADMQVVAVRTDGSPCREGEIGEICLRGANVCAGYWRNPEESRAFETVIPGLDGQFYRTGDMGTLWEDQLYLTGRIKEMIIIGGKNIFPSDIILQLCGEGVALSPAGMTVFSVHHGGKERSVLCAECRPDADFPHLAAPTVCGIAAYLSDLLNGRTGERTTDLWGECVLAEDIAPKADYTCPPETCRHVFVTGPSGR